MRAKEGEGARLSQRCGGALPARPIEFGDAFGGAGVGDITPATKDVARCGWSAWPGARQVAIPRLHYDLRTKSQGIDGSQSGNELVQIGSDGARLAKNRGRDSAHRGQQEPRTPRDVHQAGAISQRLTTETQEQSSRQRTSPILKPRTVADKARTIFVPEAR